MAVDLHLAAFPASSAGQGSAPVWPCRPTEKAPECEVEKDRGKPRDEEPVPEDRLPCAPCASVLSFVSVVPVRVIDEVLPPATWAF